MIRSSSVGTFWQQVPDFIPAIVKDEEHFVRGVGKHLLQQAAKLNLNASLLLVLCNEGDNLNHGLFLAHQVIMNALRLVTKEDAGMSTIIFTHSP